MFYFRICHLITGTLYENMVMPKVDVIIAVRTVVDVLTTAVLSSNLVLHTAFQKYNVCISSVILSAYVSSSGRCKRQTQTVDLG